MADLLIVVDRLKDWKSYYPTDNVVSFQDYLTQPEGSRLTGTRVLNLCRKYQYLSNGYYCSLLAEARGQKVLPSVRTLNDLGKKAIYSLQMDDLNATLKKLSQTAPLSESGKVEVVFFFGQSPVETLASVARQLFEQFPCPILRVTFQQDTASTWHIHSLKSGALHQLTEAEEDAFAAALDQFSRKVWRKPRSRRSARYDLAMLVDPNEAMPPSDKVALKKFVAAGKRLGIDVEMIGKADLGRLAEFDGLFIRETTGIDNHTYRFAKKAESEGMVVMDDAESILKCTNKVYLADLLATNKVPAPATRIISRDRPEDLAAAAEALGYPLVLKIPDGSFSRGVVKVADAEAFQAQTELLFKRSSLLLAQEFMYTDYDWRIGVLDGKPIFACQYFMTKGHWQIYNHQGAGKVESGGFRTMAVHEAPQKVVKAAVKAASLIGNSLYGVDLKQSGDKVVVIEVNDNPNVDSAVEDKYLGDGLYTLIMEEFLRRLERKRVGAK
ncbi:RimK family protein [Salinispirillum sp. LH 10-3-1]|uniref:RimK family protein n=1 Tax=Salinispirillum sp. LH 10-3-1 TaxID=2952525 RepID=A0AB38YGC1_9GAMM